MLSTRRGLTYEVISGYLLATQLAGSVPFYRLMYPNPLVHLPFLAGR